MIISGDSDTIVAVATSASSAEPGGAGSICVIRISGPCAFDIAAKIYRGKKPFASMKPYTVGYGAIVAPTPPCAGACANSSACPPGGGAARAIDEVLIIKMRAPKSYTREDVVEIHCHAGSGVQRRILRLILDCGARAAMPGEFTKRAFLNGRIDLSQAEAVMDLIRAKGDAGASMAMRQLEGALSAMLADMRESLIGLVASLEAFLDFPEHEVEERSIKEIDGELGAIEQGLGRLAASFEYGRIARDGLTAVIAGRPNVGKSTLFNLFAGRDRAIVTDTPGTTRDIIDEYVHLGGFAARFLDTAGIRDASDAVERIGVERAVGAIGQADVVLLMFGADEGFCDGDAQLLRLTEGKKRVFIINKIDLAGPGAADAIRRGIAEAAPALSHEVVEASLINGDGPANIESAIIGLFAGQSPPGLGDAVLTNARHCALVLRGCGAVRGARAALGAGLPLEMPIIDMREALSALGEITGETYSDDIIDRIFSEFCIGK